MNCVKIKKLGVPVFNDNGSTFKSESCKEKFKVLSK